MAGEHPLRDLVPAAERVRDEPADQAGQRADQRGGEPGRSPAQPGEQVQRAQQAAVVDDAGQPGDDAQQREDRQRRERRDRIAGDVERGELAAHRARDHVGGDRGDKGGSEDVGREVPLQFFEDEHQAGERGVERGGQPGARARGDQRLPRADRHAQRLPHRLAHRRAHLNRRPLAPEREPGADCHYAAGKLHRQDAPPVHLPEMVQHGFDMRDAAARGLRRDATGERARHPGCHGAAHRQHGPAPHRMPVRPAQQLAATRLARRERPAEHDRQQPGQKSHQQSPRELVPPGLVPPHEVPNLPLKHLRVQRGVRFRWFLQSFSHPLVPPG